VGVNTHHIGNTKVKTMASRFIACIPDKNRESREVWISSNRIVSREHSNNIAKLIHECANVAPHAKCSHVGVLQHRR
jgi:hypothetical protein